MSSSSIRICSISISDFGQTLKLFSQQYAKIEPLGQFLKHTPEQFQKEQYEFVLEGCRSGHSFGLKVGQRIVGVLLAMDYPKFVQIFVKPSDSDEDAIFMQCLKGYKPNNPDKTMYWSLGYVSDGYRNNSWFSILMHHMQIDARKKGYEQLSSFSTSSLSSTGLINIGFQLYRKVYYYNFQIKGRQPFKGYLQAEYASLVYKDLIKKMTKSLKKESLAIYSKL